MAEPAVSPSKRWWHRLAPIALVLLGSVFLLAATLAIVAGAQWWENRFHFGGTPTAEQVRFELEAYRDRADTLYKMTAAMIGLSSLYAAVLGVTTYVTAQHFTERARESFDRAKESAERVVNDLTTKEQEFTQHYPVLADLSKSVTKVVGELTARLLTQDDRMDALRELSPQARQEIRYYEQSVAYFEFLNTEPLKVDLSEIYRSLGKFHGAEGAAMRGRIAEIARAVTGAELAAVVELMREENQTRFERARFYFEKSHSINPANFAALNDLGFLLYRDFKAAADAQEKYRRSLQIQPRQQRAHYNMAVMLMDRGDYPAAAQLLTTALTESNWQSGPSRERTADIRYNRACCYSRMAEAAAEAERQSLLDKAEADVARALEDRNAELVGILKNDVQPDGDLRGLAANRPQKVTEILRELGVA